MPNLVVDNRTCTAATISSAQTNSVQGPRPNQVTTQPVDGALTGEPPEMTRDSPCSRKAMPSVVMNAGTLNTVRISPFTVPMTALTTSAPSSATNSGAPLLKNTISRNGDKVNTNPAERSISPQISSITWPAATIAQGATYCAMVW